MASKSKVVSFPKSLGKLAKKESALKKEAVGWKKAIFTATVSTVQVVETNCILVAENKTSFICLDTKPGSSKGIYSTILKRDIVSMFGSVGELAVINHKALVEVLNVVGKIVSTTETTIVMEDVVNGEVFTIETDNDNIIISIMAAANGTAKGAAGRVGAPTSSSKKKTKSKGSKSKAKKTKKTKKSKKASDDDEEF